MTTQTVIRSTAQWTMLAVCLLAVPHGRLVAQRLAETPSYESLLDPTLVKLNVARVGSLDISGIEFKLSYEFGPAFVKRVKDSKLRCLNFMVNEKLLALEARELGLDRWPDVHSQVAEIEGDLATEELYKEDVLRRVKVSKRRIALGVAKERVQLTVEWVFTPNAAEMDAAAKRLKAGTPFDSLFAAQFVGSALTPADRSMTMTLFKLTMKNPMLAAIVDTMSAGSVSLPVHGPDGWYLVKITDRSTTVTVTQSEQMKLNDDVRRSLVQHLGDSLSDAYVRSVVGSRQPVIMRAPLNAIVAHMGRIYLDSVRYRSWKLQEQKGARALADVADLGPIASDTLVTMTQGCFRVNDFLEWFRMREPYITLGLASPKALLHSVEEMVWRMVRDRVLTQKAYARGLHTKPSVKRQTAWWKEKMLYTANKNRIGDSIVDSLPALRAYYQVNQRRFADSLGVVKPFDDVRDDVWRAYYADEFTRKMLHETLRLRKKYGVTIDEKALNRIPVDDENDPRTIDVYSVKKGGTYPHAAFPSIDQDWQSWN